MEYINSALLFYIAFQLFYMNYRAIQKDKNKKSNKKK